MPHDLTHSPTSLWLLDGDLTDEVGTEDLTAAHGAARYLEIGGIGSGIRGLYLEEGVEMVGASDPAPASLRITGSMTLEMLFQPAGITTGRSPSTVSILASCAGDPEAVDSLDENFLWDLRLANSSNRLATFNEEGAGSNNYYESIYDLPDNTMQHLAMVRDVSGGNGNVIHRLFRNEAMVYEHTTGRFPTGGTAAQVRLGFFHSSIASSDATVRGILASVKLIPSALTNDQVFAESVLARAGLQGASGSPPVVTWVDPLEGNPIDPSGTITVEVTDVDNDLALAITSCNMGTLSDEVIARPGWAFTGRYSASTATPITDGYRLVLRRRGGWPQTPQIFVDAADSTGNVT